MEMEQDFPIIPGKRRKRNSSEGIPFSQNVFSGKCVPFELPRDQSDFPYKRKAPHYLVIAPQRTWERGSHTLS